MSVESNYDVIMARAGGQIKEQFRILKDATFSDDPPIKKYKAIRLVADRLFSMVQPNTPCRAGCSHCCHMATAITSLEADIIAAHTGIKAAGLGATEIDRDAEVAKWKGVRCTFLGEDNLCSIYDVRPVSCRKHHSLEDTPNPCDIVDHAGEFVGAMDLRMVDMCMAFTAEQIHDIRDYFPDTKIYFQKRPVKA